MGSCFSSPQPQDAEARQRTQEIDRRLEEDYRRLRKEVKILLLGSGESGKSTVVKQMKILHQDGFNNTELLTNRQVIYRNLIDSAKSVVQFLKEFEILPANPEIQREMQFITSFTMDADMNGVPDPEIFRAIDVVWHDANTPRLFKEHQSEFYLMDSAEYFFENVKRIGERDYLPSNDDILRARVTTTGIIETRFDMGNLSIHMFDVGGQRSERKKWIHCFEAVTCIIFCVALSEYDQVLLEVNSINRMEESLTLFGSIVNSAWFTRTSIVLFLNKIDIFRRKLLTVPLERYYPDYEGGPDPGKAAKYILYRFSQMKQRSDMMVYPHLTQATDTSNIRLVFAAVKETILQNALRDAGVL